MEDAHGQSGAQSCFCSGLLQVQRSRKSGPLRWCSRSQPALYDHFGEAGDFGALRSAARTGPSLEAQETWESKVAELMDELAASESRLQQYHFLEQEHRNFASKHRLMQDLYEKMLPTVCQTQGVPPCDHAKENVVLLERLLEVTEELQSANEAQKASTKEQVGPETEAVSQALCQELADSRTQASVWKQEHLQVEATVHGLRKELHATQVRCKQLESQHAVLLHRLHEDSSARTARLLKEVQWQLSEAKEQLAESRSASLAIQSEASKLRGPSEGELQLEMRLELQQRLSQQLRAELEAERAERAGNRPAVKREEAPTLDLAALGPGSKIKQALSGPGPREAPGTASQADEERRSRMYVEQNAVTVPLLPPPKVVSVAGDDESSSILSPRSTDPYATVNTRVASTKQAVESFPDQRKNRVLYLDASLDVPGEQQSEHLGLLHEAPHGQGRVGSCSLSHLPLREEVLGREPLACRIAPAPGTSPWIPQAQAVLQARQTKELANVKF
ncbi:unnamed protein product [Symbiodinium sp. KB8]|nr:unnamed protein product [Symbiodinium sp. KB8]